MDDIYKASLKQLRKNKILGADETVNGLIYAVDWFYSYEDQEVSTPVEEVSEKSLVLDSFTQSVKEKMATAQISELKEDGAHITLKKDQKEAQSLKVDSLGLSELIEQSNQILDASNSSLRLNGKEEVKVAFVSDFLFSKSDYEENEFNTLFEGDITKLFSNMVKAMKLSQSEFLLSGIKLKRADEEMSYKDQLLKELAFFKPQLIISLGVSATHGLLEIKDRIKDIHGQFYDFEINQHKTSIMPLFSPHLLGSAPNMKKIAWEDMQKAMQKLSL